MPLPLVGIDPHPFTIDEFEQLGEAKLELCGGILFCNRKARLDLLMALMANVGLRAVIRLADRQLWETALNG